MASPNAVFSEMVTTTMRHHKHKVVDNVSKHNALLRRLKERGNIKTDAAGGYEIALPLSYAENGTYQRFSGYDVLNIGASDVLSAAKYDWRQVAIHVTANGRELRMNNSKERMINLMKARVDVAMATAANNMSVDLYSDGALTNQIGGLAHQIQADGTGVVGGINAGTYAFWKNKFSEIATDATVFANVKKAMNAQWLLQTRGADKPDLIVATHDLFSVYESGLQDLQRYSDTQKASVGFGSSLKYKTADIEFDDNTNFGTTSELMYFLDTQYLYLMEHPDARWTEDDEKTPINQDAVVIPIYWMGQVCCSRRAGQGRIHDLA